MEQQPVEPLPKQQKQEPVERAAKVEQAEQVFRQLSDGGTIQMPFEETFWAVRFGVVVDRFGIGWMINVGKPEMEINP